MGSSKIDFSILKEEVYGAIKRKPINWRKGQFIFNYIEVNYGPEISRAVQSEDGVDCFYDDDYIDKFLECCAKRILGL